MYMAGEGHVEVEYQYGKFVLLSNEKIDAKKKDNFYAEILQIGIKENKYTNNNSLKERIKVDIQNRVRNVTMEKFNKTDLVHFIETSTWRLYRPIDTAVVDT